MLKNTIIFLFIIVLIISCKSGGDKSEIMTLDEAEMLEGDLEISKETINDIIQSVSSPVEMAALVKELGVDYSNKYLAPTTNASELSDRFSQALNLGIYAADLGYLNMYNKTSSVIEYITAIKTLADEIRVGQFFDFNTLKRLAQNYQNLDSLMYLSLRSFNEMDQYLRDNDRSGESALIITGIWIEGLYLATQVANDSPNHPELAERIGEQKIILEKLILIIDNYKKNKQFAGLLEDLNAINAYFKDIEIKYIPGEPVSKINEKGELEITQNEQSVVEITDKQLKDIIAIAKEIRNKLLKI
jgi:hypothetical protein